MRALRSVFSPMDIHISEPFGIQVKKIAVQDLKFAKYSAEEVARAVAALSGRELTLPQLEAFIDPAKPNSFPLEIVPAWVRVTGSRRLLDLLMERA